MKPILVIALSLMVVVSASAQLPKAPKAPDAASIQNTATAAAAQAGDAAFSAAKTEFNKLVKDIPFAYNSTVLMLNDPNYSIAGINVDTFMKQTVIPALVKVVSLLPANKQVTITGHASRDGTEEASDAFQGNVALSKARATALMNYIINNSNLTSGRFKLVGAGSADPLSGSDPASAKNCRASIVIE